MIAASKKDAFLNSVNMLDSWLRPVTWVNEMRWSISAWPQHVTYITHNVDAKRDQTLKPQPV